MKQTKSLFRKTMLAATSVAAVLGITTISDNADARPVNYYKAAPIEYPMLQVPYRSLISTPAQFYPGATPIHRESRSVYFEFNKSQLTAHSRMVLDELAETMRQRGTVIASMSFGYADEIGKTRYNDSLGAKRAAAVTDYLSKQGVLEISDNSIRALGEMGMRADRQCGTGAKKPHPNCVWPDRRVDILVFYHDKYHRTPRSVLGMR